MWPSYYAEPALVKVSWRKIPITLIDVRTQAVIGGCIYCRKGKRARRCESPVPPLNDKVPGCDPTVLCRFIRTPALRPIGWGKLLALLFVCALRTTAFKCARTMAVSRSPKAM